MVTKTLTITEDAYDLLKHRKVEGESFSDVIRKLAMKKGDISQFYGAWRDLMTEEEAEQMKHDIEEADKRNTEHVFKKLARHGL
ncbi:MAG TPA: antitoxin VapB family protein [Candidatus Nanoarchaeia archaeon]|nr:antitoxin VapB family protein [Candidatus Nanoarchaeia archaeon]